MYIMTARKYWEMALAAADPLEVEGQQRVEVSVLTEEDLWQTMTVTLGDLFSKVFKTPSTTGYRHYNL